MRGILWPYAGKIPSSGGARKGRGEGCRLTPFSKSNHLGWVLGGGGQRVTHFYMEIIKQTILSQRLFSGIFGRRHTDNLLYASLLQDEGYSVFFINQTTVLGLFCAGYELMGYINIFR
jgi:hypothetical protein